MLVFVSFLVVQVFLLHNILLASVSERASLAYPHPEPVVVPMAGCFAEIVVVVVVVGGSISAPGKRGREDDQCCDTEVVQRVYMAPICSGGTRLGEFAKLGRAPVVCNAGVRFVFVVACRVAATRAGVE